MNGLFCEVVSGICLYRGVVKYVDVLGDLVRVVV